MEDHAKGDVTVPDTVRVQKRPKWSKQQLCTSVLTPGHELRERSARREHDLLVSLSVLLLGWTKRIQGENCPSLREVLQDHSEYPAPTSCSQKSSVNFQSNNLFPELRSSYSYTQQELTARSPFGTGDAHRDS